MCDYEPAPDTDVITEALDRVYGSEGAEPDPSVLAAAAQTLQRTKWQLK
jgi:hypothetical protein